MGTQHRCHHPTSRGTLAHQELGRVIELKAYDVVIAGAGIAGSTAAIGYGRAGLSVALVDRRADVNSHKVLCGHFVLGGSRPTLERLGLWDHMVTAGAAVTERLSFWCPSGWIMPPSRAVPPAISLRRARLDPLLRHIAQATPGVDLLMGCTVTAPLEDADGTLRGLVIRDRAGTLTQLRGTLVVAADGHHSTVARLAGVPEDVAPNRRFLFWVYHQGARMRGPGDGQVWLLGSGDAAVSCRTDNDLTLIGVFPTKARLEEFARDREGAYRRLVAALPEAPDLTETTWHSRLVGTTDYPCISRPPAPRPRLALIGDAATTGDPVPAVGCGWAFRSAEWLVQATAPELSRGSDPSPGQRAYARAHRFIDRYDKLSRDDAQARPPKRLQRSVRHMAVHDPDTARRLGLFAMRAAPPSVLLNPGVMMRSVLHRRA
jgi:2-polyprenyl-6-methoxyphenol hydroxylase-like FAD-dependent oxidoreductase